MLHIFFLLEDSKYGNFSIFLAYTRIYPILLSCMHAVLYMCPIIAVKTTDKNALILQKVSSGGNKTLRAVNVC